MAIPFKKTDRCLVPYLLRDELQAILDAPDPAKRDGIRDRAMLHLAVCAGLRVSELTGLKIEDIDLPSMSIRVLGKGRRERTLPLWKTAAAALRSWLAIRGQVAAPEVFVNSMGEPLSRWGFAYLLKQHAATAAREQRLAFGLWQPNQHVFLVKPGEHVSVYESGRKAEHLAALDQKALRQRRVERPHKLRRRFSPSHHFFTA